VTTPAAGPVPVTRPVPVTGPRGPRPHFTGRAAVLAVVLCAIALSLAYPVREYIAQRRQIDQLQAQRSAIWLHLKRLESQSRRLDKPAYIEQQARDRLHMCLPTEHCYVIIGPAPKSAVAAARRSAAPWYARIWSSVQQADAAPAGGPRRARQPAGDQHSAGPSRR